MERMKKIGGAIIGFIKKHKIVTILIALFIILTIVLNIMGTIAKKTMMAGATYDYAVERRNITNIITGSATIEPKDSYTITSRVSGEIAEDYFEEGDVVTEGDLLYQIDTSDIEKNLESAGISVERAENTYENAVEAEDNLSVKANETGKIKSVHIKAGDQIQQGMIVAYVYDDSRMKVEIPFNDTDADHIHVGASATVTVTGTGTVLPGTVTKVSSGATAGGGYSLTRMVTIEVLNPGALTPQNTATAMVGNYACNSGGSFSYVAENTITAKTSGKVEEVYVSTGDYVNANTTVALLSSDAIEDNLENSQLSLRESKLAQERTLDQLEDYTITAPISGTVIEKNSKKGDNISSTGVQTEMAIIYDMSALTFELSIDELDVGKIQVGQKVSFTAEAIDGKEYEGTVTKVSVNGTTTNGVTAYPITVTVTEFDESLLPGMNIDASIVVEERQGVLAVPVSAVNRGNTVYVKGEKESADDQAPEGYKTVEVKVGISDEDYIEIISGLKEGDVVQVTRMNMEGTDMMKDMQEMMQGGGMQGGMPGGGMPQGGMGKPGM